MGESAIKTKSDQFSLRIIKLYKHLVEDKKEYILSKQILRCGTSIGANIEEASGAQSKKDFIAKFHISLKEAKETHYWLRLIKDSDYAEQILIDSFLKDCDELIIIMTSVLNLLNCSNYLIFSLLNSFIKNDNIACSRRSRK